MPLYLQCFVFTKFNPDIYCKQKLILLKDSILLRRYSKVQSLLNTIVSKHWNS